MSMKQLNILLSVVTLIICAVFWSSAVNIVEPADVYPKALIIVIGSLAVVILIQALFFKKDDSKVYPFANLKYNRVITTIIFAFVYYFGVEYIGFYVSSFIFIIVLSFFLGKKEDRTLKEFAKLIVISLVVTAIIYLGFDVFLKVPTPDALLF